MRTIANFTILPLLVLLAAGLTGLAPVRAGVAASVAPGDTTSQQWKAITPDAVNDLEPSLPVTRDGGPAILQAQLLLDRALFSPGVLDGRWGRNTETAVYWFQRSEGLDATGTVDKTTFRRLVELAGDRDLIQRHELTSKDVEGPFVSIPDDVYAQAEMDCLCYESLAEKLGERFHATPNLLERLNPGVDLNRLQAGDTIWVPSVERDRNDLERPVEQIIVSDGGNYVQAQDAEGRILYHFPSTLGSEYDPSPTGEYRVDAIAYDPTWHYQPELLDHVDDSEPDAILPPGPNNAVGLVWMDLSKPHYGIHGTDAPETIGYATSAGCVRLTNWDALFLADRIERGVPVSFIDTNRRANASLH